MKMAHTNNERISYPARLLGYYANGTVQKKSRNDRE